MESAPVNKKNSVPKLEKAGVNEAGYSTYKVNREDSDLESYVDGKEEGWLSEEQKKSLRGYLMAIGVVVVSANFIEGNNKPASQESRSENKNAVTFTFENDAGETVVQNEAQSGVEKNFRLPNMQAEDSEIVDKFTAEVEKFAGDIDDVDLAETLEFANKSVINHEEFTRAEYAIHAVEFRSEIDTARNRPAVPALLQNELKNVLPGWIAQESRFKGDAVSSSKAAGIAQVLPSTWKEYRGTDKVSFSMEEQMDVFGQLVSDNYHYITHFAGEEAFNKLKSKFDSEESFIKELLTPLMVNAYNAGGPLIGKMLKSFVEEVPESELESGKDLFVQFTAYAEITSKLYKQEQKEYAKKVYAFQSVFDDLGDRNDDELAFR